MANRCECDQLKTSLARVLDAAIAWQLSLDSGDGSAVEREEFSKWLASNEEHARAWRQLGMLDQRFGVASGPARAALLQSREGIRQRVRKLGTGLASIALVCGLALFAGERYVPIHYWLADQRTATGEQRTLKLADGTQINLNTHSAIDVRFDEKRRLIVLQEGEILVETGHNDARPFYVQTRDGSLRALGTRFIVRREDDATRLSVLQSAVAAQPRSIASRTDLQGRPASADAWRRPRPSAGRHPLPPTPGPAACWWSTTPAWAMLVDELSRYRTRLLGCGYQTWLTCASPAASRCTTPPLR